MGVTLYVVSRTSEILTEAMLKDSGRKVVLTAPRLSAAFASIGLASTPVEFPPATVLERDVKFADELMPGKYGDTVFPGTDLPAWKILSIDRLRFWYHATWEAVKNAVDLVNADRLVIPFDINNVLPWIAVAVAKERNLRVEAYKVHTLYTREVLDFLPLAQIDRLVVSTENERQLLLKHSSKCKIISAGFTAKPRAGESSALLEDTIGIYFESRYDWKFLAAIQGINLGNSKLLVCVPNNREWQKFVTAFGAMLENPNIEMREAVTLARCEEVYLPAYIEDIVREIPVNVKLKFYDIANTEKAGLLHEANQ
jgi:hypothetical protein